MRRGTFLYYIAEGHYPNVGRIMPWGRFYSWNHAESFLKAKFGDYKNQFTIMCENGCPF